MKTITLTESQIEKVCTALENVEGAFEKFIEADDLLISVCGSVETDGYVEDDYYNGTGAYVETSREVSVNVMAYTEDEEEFNVSNESEIEDYLMTA